MERMPVMTAQPRLETFAPAQPSGHKNVDNSPPSSPTDVGPKRNTFDAAAVAAKNEVTVAEEVVLTMGIPDTVITMAKFSYLHKHGCVLPDAHQLYMAAENLWNCPQEAERVRKLYELFQKKEKVRGRDLVDGKDSEASATSKISACETVKETSAEPKSPVDGKAQLKEKVKRLAQENHRLRQRKTCRACLKVDLASSGVTYLPCGHFITCETCSEKFDDCPACGRSIMGTVRTFLS